ncbi:uncharacterized protein CC84DRAFT_1160919 [Paraphaeosphaeria sporulosa]|uniref:F-box domain-containing protein n=1 Tax=Paraphaeosphaeria sporulosa TaxID=1460663 RepID=A0A177CSG4_9PLEO|nr:uncharacterized protein CC84DRAFT_1160919 [Paraphaeosphaeria sporulosa]OAG09872.1 hypothetical protein CC84DRAFT_1160919 [Paraphaeosphaeria sporulosa]
MAPGPQLQRRYSVTGLTPPEDVPQVSKQQHSPKLQALDTSVQSPSCGFCDPGVDAAKAGVQHIEDVEAVTTQGGDRGRKISHHAVRRMASKRSATQLPSPNTPTTHQLPSKIAKHALEVPEMHMDIDMVNTMELDEGVFTDPIWDDVGSMRSQDYGRLQLDIPPSSPLTVSSGPPEDESIVDPFNLDTPDDTPYDSGVESLALTPILTSCALTPYSTSSSTSSGAPDPKTFLTLPPEIRHEIYLRLPDLIHTQPLIYCLSTFNNAMQHPLASVSRQVRQEALAIFYSQNTWTIKLEFTLMYEAFRDWIIRLGDGAGHLRLVTIAVRGKLFKPGTSHASIAAGLHTNVAVLPGAPPFALQVEQYCPPDGDACFGIDLSEKFTGGRIWIVRNDGTREAAETALRWLRGNAGVLWEKRREKTLNGQDWVDFVDAFLAFVR